jgi:hypothetical protein
VQAGAPGPGRLGKTHRSGLDAGARGDPAAAQGDYELRRANEILKSAALFSRASSTRPDRSEPLRRRQPPRWISSSGYFFGRPHLLRRLSSSEDRILETRSP